MVAELGFKLRPIRSGKEWLQHEAGIKLRSSEKFTQQPISVLAKNGNDLNLRDRCLPSVCLHF